MTVTIDLPPETEEALREAAHAAGLTLQEYVLRRLTGGRRRLTHHVRGPEGRLPGGKSRRRRSIVEIMDASPGPRLFPTPADVNRFLQEERDSWDR